MTRILVTGSRHWTDEAMIHNVLSRVVFDGPGTEPIGPTTVVHGDCPTGADQIAAQVARDHGWHVEAHPADWDNLGKAAGPVRNQHMADLGADVCSAFHMPDSRGTVDCARRAEQAGIPTYRYRLEEK